MPSPALRLLALPDYGPAGKKIGRRLETIFGKLSRIPAKYRQKRKPRRLAKPRGGFEQVSGRREKPEVSPR
jgi:hypothetical protein